MADVNAQRAESVLRDLIEDPRDLRNFESDVVAIVCSDISVCLSVLPEEAARAYEGRLKGVYEGQLKELGYHSWTAPVPEVLVSSRFGWSWKPIQQGENSIH